MIKIEINGKADKAFLFPAVIDVAFNYFQDLESVVEFLPHIQLVEKYNDDEYRMLFQTTELGLYQVSIYCDLRVVCDQENKIIRIEPLNTHNPVKAKASINTLIAQGLYTSKSVFKYDGLQTKINYALDIRARLPIPFTAQFIPGSLLDIIVNSITEHRIGEIAEGFIIRSKDAYLKSVPSFS